MPLVVPLVLGVQLLVPQAGPALSQTSIRRSIALPVPAQSLADALGFGSAEPSTLLLRVVHLAYERPEAEARRTRESLERLLAKPAGPSDVVPLPLSEDVWRQTILADAGNQGDLVTAILRDRAAALLYTGLSALDDDTLTWLVSRRDTLRHLRKYPQTFSAFGRSIHIQNNRILLPGGAEAEPLWEGTVGAKADKPEAFIERIISGDGRLAFLFDTIAHLDAAHQRFALGMNMGASAREARFRTLFAAFSAAAPEWRLNERPYSKPPIDGAILLSTLRVLSDGRAAPPAGRRLWDRVFRADELNEVAFDRVSTGDVNAMSATLNVDAGWLADHILRVPYAVGRRRLDALLFAQRVFAAQPASTYADVATSLRGYLSFPALMMSLERSGVTSPDVFVNAADHAARLNAIESVTLRKISVAEFQSALALIERAHRSRNLGDGTASNLIRSLCSLEVSSRSGYGPRFSSWVMGIFIKALPARNSSEETMLAALAGVQDDGSARPVVAWEGRRYRVDPAAAELERLRLIRQRQGVQTLDAALTAGGGDPDDNRGGGNGDQVLADSLLSMVYAIHLGDPEGPAVTAGNVALRHDFGFIAPPARGAGDAWRPPIEHFDGKAAWRIRGSLLGIETALSRLLLRRLDPTSMPGEPRIGAQDRQTVMLTVALMNPFALSDATRDVVVTAVGVGRKRAASLAQNPASLGGIAQDAALSEWRRHAVAWALTEHRDVASLFSLLDLFWLGTQSIGDSRGVDEWGAAALPLTGCFCLTIPERAAWEDMRGYGSAVLATQGADISLRIAETLSTLQLPASLAPALAAFVAQDVIEHAQLADPDDWEEFGRTVQALPRERMFDYIAALTVGGPLIGTEAER